MVLVLILVDARLNPSSSTSQSDHQSSNQECKTFQTPPMDDKVSIPINRYLSSVIVLDQQAAHSLGTRILEKLMRDSPSVCVKSVGTP